MSRQANLSLKMYYSSPAASESKVIIERREICKHCRLSNNTGVLHVECSASPRRRERYADGVCRQRKWPDPNLLELENPQVNTLPSSAPRPLISCVMPTFGRPSLVNESIALFLQQDYPHKELVIVNDCPGQILSCEIPGIRVFNYRPKFKTLGEKRNATARHAHGDILANWDDDDVYLPWHLTTIYESMWLTGAHFFRPAQFLAYWGEESLHDNYTKPDWNAHASIAISRTLWEGVGGYPTDSDCTGTSFLKQAHEWLGESFVSLPVEIEKRSFILRGCSPFRHLNISGGSAELDRTPGNHCVYPTDIADPHLRRHIAERIATYGEAVGNIRRDDGPDCWLISADSRMAEFVAPSGCGGAATAQTLSKRANVSPLIGDSGGSDRSLRFAFVRSPYERLVVLFCNALAKGQIWPTAFKNSFECFVRSVHLANPQPPCAASLVQQLTARGSLEEYDLIGRVEHIKRDLQSACKLLGLQELPPPAMGTEGINPWQAYYTPELANLVRDKYREDFRVFDFSPDIVNSGSELPFISCICPTYKRPAMLRNSLACFLSQNYPADRCELIIMDDANQYSPQSGPNWRLLTVSDRFPTLPDKYNALATLVDERTTILIPWEDDEIYSPRHLPAIGRAWNWSGRNELTHFAPSHVWSTYDMPIGAARIETNAIGRFHSTWAMTTELFKKVGGYPKTGELSFDLQMGSLLRTHATHFIQYEDTTNPTCVYRWGNGSYHGSEAGEAGFTDLWNHIGTIEADPVEELTPQHDPAAEKILAQLHQMQLPVDN